MFVEKFYPGLVTESVYALDWEVLAKRYAGVAFDIDNTLVPHGAAADEAAAALFGRLRALGLKTVLVSNNGEGRVKAFAGQVGSGYVYKAGKPKKTGYKKALKLLGTAAADTLFVGDQIFTDVWGANRAGMASVLTEPVDLSTDVPQVTLKRWLEKPFRRVRGQKGKGAGRG